MILFTNCFPQCKNIRFGSLLHPQLKHPTTGYLSCFFGWTSLAITFGILVIGLLGTNVFLLSTFTLPKYEKLWRKLQIYCTNFVHLIFPRICDAFYIWEYSLHSQYFCNFSQETESKAFFVLNAGLKRRARKRLKALAIQDWTHGCP